MAFYTYMYFRSSGTPYYIGKGSHDRAFISQGRVTPRPKENSRIFIQYWASEQEAFEMEKYYIRLFGRKDLGTGILRNMTDGGEGASGWSQETLKKFKERVISLETRHKQSISLKKVVHTKEWNEKASAHMKGNKFWLNKKHSLKTRKKQSKSAKGNRNAVNGWTPERRAAQAIRAQKMTAKRVDTFEASPRDFNTWLQKTRRKPRTIAAVS